MSRRTAYHEAGHALAALAVGRTLVSVSIDEDGGGVTQFEAGPRSDDLSPAELERELSILFAAKFAERYA